MTIYKFGVYELNPRARTLEVLNDCITERRIKLSSAETVLLENFISHPEIVFSRDELQTLGWEGRPVGTNSLPVAITALRKYLSFSSDIEIITVPRKGYYCRLHIPLEEIIVTQQANIITSDEDMGVGTSDEDVGFGTSDEDMGVGSDSLSKNKINSYVSTPAPVEKNLHSEKHHQLIKKILMVVGFLVMIFVVFINFILFSDMKKYSVAEKNDSFIYYNKHHQTIPPEIESGKVIVYFNDEVILNNDIR